MRRFRVTVVLVLHALILAACEPVTAPTTTTLDVLPPPDPIGSTSTSAPPSSPPPTKEPERFTYRGSLPDGTNFTATIPGKPNQFEESTTLVTGVFNVDVVSQRIPVGEVRYTRVLGPPTELGYADGVMRLFEEPWLVEIIFDPVVLDDLASPTEADLEQGIQMTTQGGYPVIHLEPPFTWGGANPQVRFVSFVVASGCWPEAARCTDNHAVQVISANDIFIGGAGLNDFQLAGMTLRTTSSRSPHDPYYLDPGPLSPRNSASVMWTGEEMIVWGGKEGRDGVPSRVDGAAFNPETNQWRTLARFPFLGSFGARAIWGDGEMLVVSSEGTLAFDPDGNSWREIGQALIPPEYNDRMLYLDGVIYVWDRAFLMHRMDIDVGIWETIPAPDEIAGAVDQFYGALRVIDGRLFASTSDGGCSRRGYWAMVGDSWGPLPEVSLGTTEFADCSFANQSASIGDSLIVWDSFRHPVMSYSVADESWRELPSIPLDGTEGASGPVAIGDGHFLVPRWGEAAIFSATAGDWTLVSLPGSGTDPEIVWTGKEFLAWGIWGTFDSWRWTPPDDALIGGGDDAS